MTHSQSSPDRFGRLIDIYGADLARWPDSDRAWGQAFALSSPEAAKLLAEERALDGVLSLAAKPTADQVARLSASIMAEIKRTTDTPITPVSSRNVVAFEADKRDRHWVEATRSTVRPAVPVRRWQAGAGLAASLVLGLLIGSFEMPALSYFSIILGSGAEQEVVQFVSSLSGDGLTPSLDEDYL